MRMPETFGLVVGGRGQRRRPACRGHTDGFLEQRGRRRGDRTTSCRCGRTPRPGTDRWMSEMSSPLLFAPTVVVDVPAEELFAREETPGPVALVVSIRSAGEALPVASASGPGLLSSAGTRDIGRAMQLCDALCMASPTMPTGICVNPPVPQVALVAWGGRRAVLKTTEVKAVTQDVTDF